MRILHVLAQRPGHTGSGVFLQSLVAEASTKNHDQAAIIGISATESVQLPTKIPTYPVCFQSKDIPFPVVGMSDEMPYNSTRYSDLSEEMFSKWKQAFSIKLQAAINEFKPDIILSHHLWLLTSLAINLAAEVPIFAICHGTGLRQMKLAQQFSEHVKQNIRKATQIFALTDLQKEKIIEIYDLPAEKITVTGSGFNPNIFFQKKKIKNTNIKIVYAGKLSRAKGVHSLLKVLAKLPENQVEIIIAGSAGNQEKKIVNQLSSKISLPINFKGNISQSELAEIFRASDIFVLPSFYEGLPLVIIEAIACGMRIVVTELPGLRDVLKTSFYENGIVEFIPLPRLEYVDQPVQTDLPIFEENLQIAICTQVNRVNISAENDSDSLQKYLSNWTWEGLFNKMEKHF